MDGDGLPKLELLGIMEVDDGVCEDTFENRRRLRDAKLRWRLVPTDSDGHPTGLIEVYAALDLEERQQRNWDRLKPILADPRDPWSDYLPATEYPQDVAGVPFWVHRRVEKHLDDVARGLAPHRRAILPTRCVHVRRDGTRCWFWSFDKEAEGRCRNHSPGTSHANNQGFHIAARQKVMQALPQMADELEGLALNAASEQVRLKAITEMMDRGGLRAGVEVEISGGLDRGQDPAEVIRGKLEKLAERMLEGERRAAELDAREAGETVEGRVLGSREDQEPA
jgi:hypothetical protein